MFNGDFFTSLGIKADMEHDSSLLEGSPELGVGECVQCCLLCCRVWVLKKMMFEGVYLAAAGRKEDRDQSSSLLEGFPSGAW